MKAVCFVLVALSTCGDDLVVAGLQMPVPVFVLSVLPYFEVHITPHISPLPGGLIGSHMKQQTTPIVCRDVG